MNKHTFYTFLFILSAGWLAGCSAERKGPFSKVYQNTTARYNAFFIGNEKLMLMQADMAAKDIPDFNRVLPIFPITDSILVKGYKKELEEIIKKASYPIQKHPTSDWTDDSYLLIGKARFLGLEYEDAIQAFKYVNSTSQKEETRHEALLWLMRSFVNIGDLESAKAVSDIMKKQFLNKDNARLLFLTRAQYYLLRNETPLAIENLKLAIPLFQKKDEETRTRFILAQLYQQANQNKLAYEQFSRILRKTPPYELGFQSKLHLGQVTEIANANDKERIDKYFKKLRKDTKNQEYLDKVYYEMAKFELKQNKTVEALNLLNQSVKASTKNLVQKGYSYLLAGQIYYDKLQKFTLAQAYYDSAVMVLPPTAADYAAAAERRDVLNEFATQYTLVNREDSLQLLATLSKPELDKRIDAIIILTETEKAEKEKRAAAAADISANQPLPNTNLGSINNTPNATGNNVSASTGGLWYFDNPITVGTARAEFIRRWGNRKLQDNWRINNQAATDDQNQLATSGAANSPRNTAETAAQQDALRVALLADLPLTAEKKANSDKKIEDGLFNLANIYRLKLREPARAAETYEKLLTRFPRSRFAAEAYYTLYLIYKDANDPKQTTYANLIKQQFPKTRYAILLDKPDYLAEVSAANSKARQLYDSAFTLYENQKYPAAANVLNAIRLNYPETDLIDKVAFLNVMIIAQTEQPALFKLALQQFLKTYPSSPLAENARTYLASFELYEKGKLSETTPDKSQSQLVTNNNRAGTNALNTPDGATPSSTILPAIPANLVNASSPYTINLQLPHMVVVAYTKGDAAFAGIEEKIKLYNTQFNATDTLIIEPTAYNQTQNLLIIRGFTDSRKAKLYAAKQKSSQSPLSKLRGTEFVTFVVSSENLPLLMQYGNLEKYLIFYKNNY